MEEMAAHYLREMRQIQPHGPYYLGGFCFGGIAASEIARQLIAGGERVALLASFDAPAPVTVALPRPVVRRYRRFLLRRQVVRQLELMRSLPVAGKIAFLADHAARLGSKIAGKLRRREQPVASGNEAGPHRPPESPTGVLAANRQAVRHYRPDFYPGRVTVFRSVDSLGEVFLDSFLGWQVLAEGRVELREIPGRHHTMFDEPNVEALAVELRRYLDASAEAGGSDDGETDP